jgi:hypothetical protein
MGNLLALRLTWFLEQRHIPVKRLFLDAPFSTMLEEVQSILSRYRLRVFHRLLPDAYQWSNVAVAAQLRVTPVTQLIRTQDTMIPVALQEQVWQALRVPKIRIDRPWSHHVHFAELLQHV